MPQITNDMIGQQVLSDLSRIDDWQLPAHLHPVDAETTRLGQPVIMISHSVSE
jgi:hypothetical protein